MAMMLALKATKPPVLEVVPSSANFSAPGQMGVYVLDSNSKATLAFIMGMVSNPPPPVHCISSISSVLKCRYLVEIAT